MKNYILILEQEEPDYDRDPLKREYYPIGFHANDGDAFKKAEEVIKLPHLMKTCRKITLATEIALYKDEKWFDSSRNGKELTH
ncbi:MAG: hypothetical protein AAB484_02620 [Patescibacteria group bacterium]